MQLLISFLMQQERSEDQQASGFIALCFVQVDVLVNAPPTSGILQATPVNGSSLQTQFNLLTFGWTDDPADFPFLYSFSFLDNSTSIFSVLRGKGNVLQVH